MGRRSIARAIPPLRAVLAAVALLSAPAPRAAAQDSRGKQEIVFPELPPRTVGDAPFTVAAKASSGLPVTLEIVSGPAVLDGKRVKLTNAPGLVIIRARQDGNDAFLPAPVAERAFAVNARPSAPAILVQPAGGRFGVGEIIMLSVDASGEPRPTFQWRKDGSPISDAVGSRLTIASASPADAGTYDVVVSNPIGSVASEHAQVTVGKRSQTISFQGSTSATAGQAVPLVANASSGLPVTFDVMSGVAVVNGTTMTAQQAGTIVVQASQPGDQTYDAAAPVTQTFFVSAAPNGQHIP
jgi:hypothetical protein